MILSLKMALRSIGSNKLRSALTMLGIIIGVMALVVLVSLVSGATSSVTDQVESLGSNYIEAYIWDYSPTRTLTLDILQQWAEDEDSIGGIAPNASMSFTAKYGAKSKSLNVFGTTPAFYDINGMQLSGGRFLKNSDVENATRVCVLGESTAEALIGYTDCVGEEIAMNGLKYTVVGVLTSGSSLMYSYNMDSAYIPYTTMTRQSAENYMGTTGITDFYVSAPEGYSIQETSDTVNRLLLDRYGSQDNYYVYAMDMMENAMGEVSNILTILLGGIASISLIVGGIGIMNIMLVTVTERTREIGIRKAVGANRGMILRQFLLEAVVLCMMGCVIGVFLSWCILRLASIVVADVSMSFSLNGGVVLLSAAFCFVIGVVFGLYPANKAAKMKPIDALHYGG